MTANAGAALKTLFQTSTAASDITTEAYTITYDGNSYEKTKNVTKSGHTARGQLNVRRGSGQYQGTVRLTVSSNTVTNRRYIENSTGNTAGEMRFTEIYY